MNVQTDNVETEKLARRKRKAPPRRVPAVIEQREKTPVIFGWGADLTTREREALKEKIALFGGIALAIILAGLLGWGALNDYVIKPAQVAAANNVKVAQIGNYTVRMGFFKRLEKFRANQLQQQITSVQQQLQQYQASPKKNAPVISGLEQELGVLQQQQGTISTSTLSTVITDQTLIQRSSSLGIVASPKDINGAMYQMEKQAGGRIHLQIFIQQSGLTPAEFKMLVVSDLLQKKVQAKLNKTVSPYQETVRASHILVAPKKHALAVQIYNEVLHGANFAALAAKYSIDPGSAKKGGDLGYFAHGTMVAPFDKAAFSMKVGEVRLVQSQYGWHIIKLTGRKQTHMSQQQLQQAQQTAYQNWLTKEQSIIHVQRFVAPAKLPSPQINVNNTLPSSSVPGAAVPANPAAPGSSLPPTSPNGATTAPKVLNPATGKVTTAKPGGSTKKP